MVHLPGYLVDAYPFLAEFQRMLSAVSFVIGVILIVVSLQKLRTRYSKTAIGTSYNKKLMIVRPSINFIYGVTILTFSFAVFGFYIAIPGLILWIVVMVKKVF